MTAGTSTDKNKLCSSSGPLSLLKVAFTLTASFISHCKFDCNLNAIHLERQGGDSSSFKNLILKLNI